MRIKDASVETKFHPMITAFLFKLNTRLDSYGQQVTITSGSESMTRHGKNSLHYATPACAADIRSWTFSFNGIEYDATMQKDIIDRCASDFCSFEGIPREWLEIIQEHNHFHIEYQPKRQD